MRYRLFLAPCGALLTLLVVLCTALPGFAAGGGRHSSLVQPRVLFLPTPTATVPAATVKGIVITVLQNIHNNGFDAQANDGLGGLWINWRYGTQPLQTNFDDAGNAHGSSVPPRQDRLVDLRYVHNLWLYKTQHRDNAQFDGELTKYTNIVKHEFTNHSDERGWVFDMLVDLYHLSHDAFYKHAAQAEVVFLDTKRFHRSVGAYYKTSRTHPRGYYPVDQAIEAGCALLQAGSLFHNKQWTRDGKTILAFVYQHAFLRRYHVFVSYMDNVLLANGKLNPTETFFAGRIGVVISSMAGRSPSGWSARKSCLFCTPIRSRGMKRCWTRRKS